MSQVQTREMRQITIPITGVNGIWPVLTVPYPLTRDEWATTLRVLRAMKKGLTQPEPEPQLYPDPDAAEDRKG